MENIKFAIDYLKNNSYKMVEENNNYAVQASNMAIEALEKQLPYKLEDISTVYTGEKIGTCKCGYESVMEHQKHCIECGQIVDWD